MTWEIGGGMSSLCPTRDFELILVTSTLLQFLYSDRGIVLRGMPHAEVWGI